VSKEKILSDYIFVSKYARLKGNKKETWEEAVARVMNMHEQHLQSKGIDMEAIRPYLDKAKKAYLNQLVLGAQRALQWGGDHLRKKPFRMYNCSASYVDRAEFFGELMYILLAGAGVGYSVQKHHVAKLPEVKMPDDSSILVFTPDDSIEGWASAVDSLVKSYFDSTYKVEFDLSKIRAKGELVAGEFKAPGPEPLEKALELLDEILKAAVGRKLTTLEAHEMSCVIADSVISGGIRRAALISLFSADDKDMLKCKTGDWFYKKPYLARANNSAVILPDTSKETYEEIFDYVKEFGEPGFAFLPDKEVVFNP
jgi:ribonucleoside-diphosphate reductase alpha chain